MTPSPQKSDHTAAVPAPTISVRGAVLGFSAVSELCPELSFETPSRGSLTLITGPVGCGKSTLLKAILGETVSRQGGMRGTVILGTPEVAYCSQDPWLLNASIYDNIIGTTDDLVDTKWYTTAVTACALDIDFARLPHGDKTMVGSKGVKLSGGQRQRIVSHSILTTYSLTSLLLISLVLGTRKSSLCEEAHHPAR
jgi:ABC-type bacteriocin/lantibiotic exporter with double-glycine peptidase domain